MRKIKESFHDWCINNNRLDFLDLWDYDLNEKTPKDVAKSTHKLHYFKCPNGVHESMLMNLHSLTIRKNKIQCTKCNSFAQWCINNRETEWLDNWDYELNSEDPFLVPKTTGKSYYFKCNKNLHPSELTRLADITSTKKLSYRCRKCNSFGQWCINNNKKYLLERWDYDLNKISPFDISYSSGTKYYFKCPKGKHKSEAKIISNIIKQPGSELCQSCNSFAEWGLNDIGTDFLDKYWSDKNVVSPYEISYRSSKYVFIKCIKTDYHTDYKISCGNFVKGNRCPYCSGKKVNYFDSIGYLYPEIIDIWSTKNKKSAYDYTTMSNKIVWFHCSNHGEYQRKVIDAFLCKFRCPNCVSEMEKSALQTKVSEYINSIGYDVLHENNCNLFPINPKTNYHLYYDNEIYDLHLIIEVNGIQHYKLTNFHRMTAKKKNTSPEYELKYQKWKDEFKRNYALEHGYFYLEIPYWSDDLECTYKKMIDDKIAEIKKIVA